MKENGCILSMDWKRNLFFVFLLFWLFFLLGPLSVCAESDIVIDKVEFIGGTGGSKILKTDILENSFSTEGIIYDTDASLVYQITITNHSNNYKKLSTVNGLDGDYQLNYEILDIDQEKVFKPGETVTFLYSIKANYPENIASLVNFKEIATTELLFKDVFFANPDTLDIYFFVVIVFLFALLLLFITYKRKKFLYIFIFIFLIGISSRNTIVSASGGQKIDIVTDITYILSNLAPSCANVNYEGEFCIDWKQYSTIDKTNYMIMTDTVNMPNDYEIGDVSFRLQQTYDVSEQQNEDVILGVYKANQEEESYLLLLGQDKGVVVPKDASYQFTSYVAEGNDNTNDFKYIKYLDFSKFYSNKTINMSYMLTGIGASIPMEKYDLSGFETSNVTDMSYMFTGFGELTDNLDLDLSMFDTSNVTSMQGMFWEYGAKSNSIHLDLTGFDTSNVVDMSRMFQLFGLFAGDIHLEVETFDTSKVTDMSYMFFRFGVLSTSDLDIGYFKDWDTSNVESMKFMFGSSLFDYSNTSGVTEIDLRGLDFGNVIDFSYMFACDRRVQNIIFDDDVDFSSGTNFEWMFYLVGYNSPESLVIDFTKFHVESPVHMNNMFFGANIKKVDLSNWNVSKVENTNFMFSSFLGEEISISGWNLENLQTSSNMFSNLKNIERLDLSRVNFVSSGNYDRMFAQSNAVNSSPSVFDLSGSDWNSDASVTNMFQNVSGATIYVKDDAAKDFIALQAPDCSIVIP